jgi:hypothetical protein
MATYNIRATVLGDGYPSDTQFLFYISAEDCGVGTPVYPDTVNDPNPEPIDERPLTKNEFLAGFSITLEDQVEFLYVYPFTTDIASFDCRFDCTAEDRRLSLSQFTTPTSTPQNTPTQTPLAATPTNTPPAATPTNTPTADLPAWVGPFGSWTVSKIGSTQLRFINTGFNRFTDGQQLADYLAFDGYIAAGQTEVMASGVHIFTSEQSKLDPPNPSFEYIDLDSFKQPGSGLTWFSDGTQTIVDLTNLNSVPVNFPTYTIPEAFIYYKE